ncbi:MAG: hypothetical protein ACR2LI_06465 [Propionibacteriaceae bacterium]
MRVRRLVILAIVLVLVGAGAVLATQRTGSSTEPWRSGRYTHVQLNLCLSGRAGCYPRTRYPAVVDDAVGVITDARSNSAVLVEACSGDAETIARRTGLFVTFATVLRSGQPLACLDPRGRGNYGDAVLTRSAPVAVVDRPFTAQQGAEQRRYVCVTTDADVTVCGAHLVLDGDATVATQEAQCAEFAAVVAGLSTQRTTIASGDLNRTTTCAPAGDWVSADSAADQNPGKQQTYGGAGLEDPRTEIVPVDRSDHDGLVTTANRTH